ncbi:13991_t:CDS:2 [Dentiscutata heterogama]|uniref:13991_t:CDS:1 n=1 Tax=Dentiscutata heterogama TaxID=1316150 RepID=A0ACA9KC14_9GLOM|nr:13991_t:CDS:2 [Dentiscutata heterogama]
MGRIHSKSVQVQVMPRDRYNQKPTQIQTMPRNCYKRKCSISSPGSSNTTITYVGDTKMYGKNEAQRNDECDRLHMAHFSIRDLWKSNFSAPIEGLLTNKRAKVLDVGCGAGTWILDTSLNYPKSEFYGIDILPLFPQCIKPSNVTFSQCDILQRLPYDDNVFDYIHMRFMGSSLTRSAWEYAIKELVRVLKSGGYIEICEVDNIWVNEGPRAGKLRSQAIRTLIRKYNVCLMSSPLARRALRENDQLTDFHQEKKMVPMGSWGGKLGEVFLENARWGAKNLKSAVDSFGMSDARYEAMVDSAMNEIELKKNVFDTVRRFWAKKL